jgi:transcriptional regulator with XRE-family HTH domain
MTRFAEGLRAWRGDHGLNQRGAAEQIGVSWRTYQSWERGRSAPSAAGLAGLERAKAPLPIPTRRHTQDFEVRMLAELDRVRQSLRLIREEQAELHRLSEENRVTIRLIEIRLRSSK